MKKNILDNVDLTLMKSDSTLEVYHKILQTPGITISTLARRVGKRHNTISYHVSKLLEQGIIEFEKQGRQKKLFIKKEIFKDLEN